jgi:agmatinase
VNRPARQFLGSVDPPATADTAAVVVLPIPYEGGVSYGKGAAAGPAAVIEASEYLELYDERLRAEPYRMGIFTVAPPVLPTEPAAVAEAVYDKSLQLIRQGRYVVLLGGDHSVSLGYVRALREFCGRLSVIQLDAHADLRDTFENNPHSHACIMARIREYTSDVVQAGIRSMSAAEARTIEKNALSVCTMADYRSDRFDLWAAVDRLPDPVYLTVDVDAFDWSVIRSTGTPEPGGFQWDEALQLLEGIFTRKNVVGFDIVELSGDAGDRNSAFAAAKLIYKMLAFKLAAEVAGGRTEWPQAPSGPLFKIAT